MHPHDPVNRVMSAPVLTIGPDEPVKELLRVFTTHPVHHLPVVEGRHIVGMLSSADVMKLQFFLPPPGAARAALLAEQWHVKRIMQSPVIAVPEHETVQRAAELMASHGIHSLPVVDGNDELIGIVTTTDLMGACLHSLPDAGASDTESARRFPLAAAHVAAALASARRAVNTGHDPCGVSATLLSMQQRVSSLEQVANAARRYLNAGQDEHLHTALRKAIDRADRLEESLGHRAAVDLGD